MLRIALVEPDPVIAGLYVDALKLHIRACDIAVLDLEDPRLADTLSAAEVCICSAGTNPDGKFDDLVRLLLLRPDLPVVLLLPACASSGNTIERAVEFGAADVLLRSAGYLDQLPATIRRVALQARGIGYADSRVRSLRDTLNGIRAENTRMQSLIEHLNSLAATDPLTGLLNRRALDRALGRAFALSRRYGHELSCLAIDADGFKQINDNLGHAAGDELLKLIATIIVSECRQSDAAARLGGDEFVVLLPHTGPHEAAAVAERLRTRFNKDARMLYAGAACAEQIGLTIGVSSRGADAPRGAEQLLEAADAALYAGKRAGRNRVTLSDGAAQSVASKKAA